MYIHEKYPVTELTAGIDEAGIGPLAGPVVAAAVILDAAQSISLLRDSKTLSEARREQLYIEIRQKARAWGIGLAEPAEIDQLNVLQANLLAMRRAVQALHIQPDLALVDGKHAPRLECPSIAIIKGDQLIPAISAASILAKVTRDRLMLEWDQRYPRYGFARHKGYPTTEHLRSLRLHGPCIIHRKSYAPVKALLKNDSA